MKDYGFLFDEDVVDVPGIGPMMLVMAPGHELLAQREALGLTQQDVARRANIDARQYQRFETGERSLSSASFRIGLNICHVLKIDPMYYCEVKSRTSSTAPETGTHEGESVDANPVSNTEKKYILYRTDEDGNRTELVAVEYGKRIEDATERLMASIRADLAEDAENAGCDIDVYQPEKEAEATYYFQAVVSPPHADKNILRGYIAEETAQLNASK